MKCIYDESIECIHGKPRRDLCRKCEIYQAIVEGSKGCGSVEF